MGIVNVTTDSFSDGGRCLSLDNAIARVFNLIDAGADIIDIGGESSRPGATVLSLDEELARVIPLIQCIRQRSDICLSIDTYKPLVMQAAIQAGANVINDIYALTQDGALAMAASLDVPVCLMHMQKTPQTMQIEPCYPQGVMHDFVQFFSERIALCEQAGINKNRLLLDPGFGFGKRVQDNLILLRDLKQLHAFERPLLLGVSRKSTLGEVLNKKVDERLIGGIAIAVYAALQHVAVLRTHDVDETQQALQMIDAINRVQ